MSNTTSVLVGESLGASPVTQAFLRLWSDALGEDARQSLKSYVRWLVASKGTQEQEDVRAWMVLDWLVREYQPVWLRLAGLNAQADTLANLGEFRRGMDTLAIRPTINAVRKDAFAAWEAAQNAAREAMGEVAWATAHEAARKASGSPAEAVLRHDTPAAAWDAAGPSAGDPARAVVWHFIPEADRDSAAAAGYAAGAAAWAGADLQPAVAECQASAHRLVKQMLAVGMEEEGDPCE